MVLLVIIINEAVAEVKNDTHFFANSSDVDSEENSFVVHGDVPELKEIIGVPNYPKLGQKQIFRIAIIGEGYGSYKYLFCGCFPMKSSSIISFLKTGILIYTEDSVQIKWDEQDDKRGEILKDYNTGNVFEHAGFSDLVYFHGNLMTVGRHTGIIYYFIRNKFKLTEWIDLRGSFKVKGNKFVYI